MHLLTVLFMLCLCLDVACISTSYLVQIVYWFLPQFDLGTSRKLASCESGGRWRSASECVAH